VVEIKPERQIYIGLADVKWMQEKEILVINQAYVVE